ncbi:MAG: ATP-binding cassette domain-containing protein [Planctomycetota bacterium]
MLELKMVSKRYGSTVALRPTDLVAEPGRTTVLIGPSGCGKSTILRLMNGLIKPDDGTVHFDEVDLSDDNVISVRRRMGYVIQEGGLFPHLTAQQNVTLMARHLKWDSARTDTRVRELAELTHLPQPALQRYPAELSGGQRQRVSLMRALMLDPDVLLLDEPLGALDPMIRADLQGDLREVFRTLKRTVVMVTHDMAEAGFFGDTIVLLKHGEIVQQGTFASLVGEPADNFVSAFINAQRSPLAAGNEGSR